MMMRQWIVGLAVLASLLTGPVRAGTLYVADSGNGTVVTVSAGGTVSTFASGLAGPSDLAFDNAGNLYVLESGADQIAKITPDGTVSNFVSFNPSGFSATSLAFDSSGDLYVSALAGQIDKITPSGSVSTFASVPTTFGVGGMAFDSGGDLYVSSGINEGTIYKITPNGTVSAFATRVQGPLAYYAGNLYVGIESNGLIYQIAANGAVSTSGYGLKGGYPVGLTFDSSGNLYVSTDLDQIDKSTPNGGVSTFASGLAGPEGLAFAAQSVPEPSSLVMGLIGLTALVGVVVLRGADRA